MPARHEDQTLILADVARKALRQVEVVATELLQRHSDPQRARDVARLLSQGTWTHDHPLMASDLELLGLPVRVGVPAEERALMDLYPQPRGREAAVEYVPGRPVPGLPPRAGGPAPAAGSARGPAMTQREHASTPAANAQADILLAELERSRAEFERAERAARSYLAGREFLTRRGWTSKQR